MSTDQSDAKRGRGGKQGRKPAPRLARAPAREPGASRLYALLAGALLSLIGVLGFFYDSSFGTGSSLASDDLAGILLVNGWRNVVYLATGLVALAVAIRFARPVALGLGAFYLAFGLWGVVETEFGIGSILDAFPLGDTDNVFHVVLGGLGLGAFVMDGGLGAAAKALPKPPQRKPRAKTKTKPVPRRRKAPARAEPSDRRRDPSRPRPDASA